MLENAGGEDGLTRGAPSANGVNAGEIIAFLEDVERDGLELHNFILWHHDAVVAEGFHWPYSQEMLRITHSMTKSITACAIGILIDRGDLSLDAKLSGFFPEIEIADDRAKRITVRDLLTMRSGHGEEVSGSVWRLIETSWIEEFFKIPMAYEPGTTHVYSSAASYMLSAIVTKVTGETLHAFLEPLLFAPLGIMDARWDIGPDGVNPGGNGLTMTLVDALKVGILHAQNGLWKGRQLLPEWWVDLVGQPDGDEGYGYHWVVGRSYFAAVGMFVQLVLVYPEHDAVIAINAAMSESKVIVPHLNRHFPLAFETAGSRADDDRLMSLFRRWRTESSLVSDVDGDLDKLAGHWHVVDNDMGVEEIALVFSKDGDQLRIDLRQDGQVHGFSASKDSWTEARTTLPATSLHHGYSMEDTPTVIGWHWTTNDELEIVLHFVETAFRDTITVSAVADGIEFRRKVNINSGDQAWPVLAGRR